MEDISGVNPAHYPASHPPPTEAAVQPEQAPSAPEAEQEAGNTGSTGTTSPPPEANNSFDFLA